MWAWAEPGGLGPQPAADDASEGEAPGAYAAKRQQPGHRGYHKLSVGLIGGGRGRGLRGAMPAARARGGKEGTARVNSTSGQRVDSAREEGKGGRGRGGGGG